MYKQSYHQHNKNILENLKVERVIKEEIFKEELQRRMKVHTPLASSYARKMTEEFLLETDNFLKEVMTPKERAEQRKENQDDIDRNIDRFAGLRRPATGETERPEKDPNQELLVLHKKNQELENQLNELKKGLEGFTLDNALLAMRKTINTLRFYLKWAAVFAVSYKLLPPIVSALGKLASYLEKASKFPIVGRLFKDASSFLKAVMEGSVDTAMTLGKLAITSMYEHSPYITVAFLSYLGLGVLKGGVNMARHFTSNQGQFLDPAKGTISAVKGMYRGLKGGYGYLVKFIKGVKNFIAKRKKKKALKEGIEEAFFEHLMIEFAIRESKRNKILLRCTS